MTNGRVLNAERQRLENHRLGKENWRLWGPYLSERAWGTVREDYSAYGDAWDFLPHDHARSRAYRWSEDGLGGISDENQFLCLALALWNGRDPFLKERAFGLTGTQGNRGEDVKEYYFYLDATPSHSYMRTSTSIRKRLTLTNGWSRRMPVATATVRRSACSTAASSTRAGTSMSRWFTARRAPRRFTFASSPTIAGRRRPSYISCPPCGSAIPGPGGMAMPNRAVAQERPRRRGLAGASRSSAARDVYLLYGRQPAQLLFTENESNGERLWGQPNATPYVKDAFHRFVVDGDSDAVNPERIGTKFAARHTFTIPAGQNVRLDLVLSAHPLATPFARSEAVFSTRQGEANGFFGDSCPTPARRIIGLCARRSPA